MKSFEHIREVTLSDVSWFYSIVKSIHLCKTLHVAIVMYGSMGHLPGISNVMQTKKRADAMVATTKMLQAGLA